MPLSYSFLNPKIAPGFEKTNALFFIVIFMLKLGKTIDIINYVFHNLSVTVLQLIRDCNLVPSIDFAPLFSRRLSLTSSPQLNPVAMSHSPTSSQSGWNHF